MNAIDIKQLRVFHQSKPVLNDITLSVKPGEILGVIGPNSAGKSTLLKTILSYKVADSGQILIDGKPQSQWDRRALARYLAYLAQDAMVAWPINVYHIVSLGRIPHQGILGKISDADRQAIEAAIGFTNIAHLCNRNCTQLSGGELARVLLARALAVDAKVLLADEPVANLDPHYQLALLELLQQKAHDGMSVVLVLHDLLLASRFCHRLALLHEGRLVAVGPTQDVLNEATIQRYYRVSVKSVEVDKRQYLIPWQVSTKDGGM